MSQSLNILFQNEHFVLVEKSAMVLTVPGRFGDKDERPVLGRELEAHLGKTVFPIHRLDYEVSGLVLFALNGKAHSAGNSWFEKKMIQKVYQAITENQGQSPKPPRDLEQTWQSRLLRGKKRAYESPVGKPAITKATLVNESGVGVAEQLFWHLEPVTGRSHQLRYELYKRGYPIAGDALYGGKSSWNHGIALRAVKISFPMAAKDFGLPHESSISGLF